MKFSTSSQAVQHEIQRNDDTHVNGTQRRSSYPCGDQRQMVHEAVLASAAATFSAANTRSSGRVNPRKMRAKSLSRRELMAQSCACFAPLPDYAKYQDRKIQRKLSRTCIFTPEPSSPLEESRQAKVPGRCQSLDLAEARQPFCPIHNSAQSVKTTKSATLSITESQKKEIAFSIQPTQLHCKKGSPRHEPENEPPTVARPSSIVVSKPTDSRDRSVLTIGEPLQAILRVEVSPGVTTALRGVKETVAAIRNDFILPVTCLGCSLDMFCIANAEYVLCPTCRVVSPVEALSILLTKETPMGLGLGVRYEALGAIQSELLATKQGRGPGSEQYV
jgi:hypothetical protein